MGVFLEKSTKLARVNLWMHVGGDPEEVERVVRGRIGAGDIFVRVRVTAGVVARVPVARLGSCGLGAGSGRSGSRMRTPGPPWRVERLLMSRRFSTSRWISS